MGPNNLCYVTRHFLFFPYVSITFYKTLRSLSTAFIKGHVGLLQLLKWPCRTSFFTHVEPYTMKACTHHAHLQRVGATQKYGTVSFGRRYNAVAAIHVRF